MTASENSIPGIEQAMSEPVLVVEDDATMRDTCRTILERAGHPVAAAATAAQAIEWLDGHDGPCIVLTDVRMPGMDGLELLDNIGLRQQEAAVVVMTAYGTIDNAVDAMRRGAADYLTKPFNKNELLRCISRVAELRSLQARVAELEDGLHEQYRFEGFVATSPAMRSVLARLRSACRSTVNVLLTGESGTGKDVVARIVHYEGPRAAGPFVPVNCAGLPGELIESELFGHSRGAFTGAVASRTGLIRKADGGTLLLDEITEMPTSTQAKLLRVLQDKRVRPLGETEEREVDVRIIAATNRDVEQAVSTGVLREDLYYRLSVLDIHLPPLRERPEDIAPLLRYFINESNQRNGGERPIDGVQPEAIDLLLAHTWPGNVRELWNLVERCVALGASGNLTANDVRRELSVRPRAAELIDASAAEDGSATTSTVAPGASPSATEPPLNLEDLESRAIVAALAKTANNKAAAARMLGIARKTLYEKIKRYGLEAEPS